SWASSYSATRSAELREGIGVWNGSICWCAATWCCRAGRSSRAARWPCATGASWRRARRRGRGRGGAGARGPAARCPPAPGAVAGPVHSLSDPTEGITAATRSAAAGGVTTIVEMPFDAGAPINSAERFAAKRERVGREAVVDVALLATLRKRGGLDQVAPL